jgi:hypothetical protein
LTALTTKQRAKVNAALCIIHDQGLDVSSVTAAARSIMATGHDPKTAYERALNQFADSNPAVANALGKVTQLIEASCPETVAQYDHALSAYIETGDNSALVALAPTIAEDSVALAVRNGELSPEEAGAADTASLLGLAGSEEVSGEPQVAANEAQAAGFSQSGNGPQVSLIGDGPGMIAPKAQRAWAETPYVGMVSKPAPAGLSPAAAREAAKQAALGHSRATFAPSPEAAE